MSRLTALIGKLQGLEERAARVRQDGKEIPRCVFLSSGDFDNQAARADEKARLHAEYGDTCRLIEFDSVGPDGSVCWKGGPVPNLETIFSSPEYRAAERAAYSVFESEKPAGQANVPTAPETLTEPLHEAFNAVPPTGPDVAQMRTPEPAPIAQMREPEIDERDPPARPIHPAPDTPESRQAWLKEIAPRYPERMLHEPYTNETDPPPKPETNMDWCFGGPAEPEPQRDHPGEIRFVAVPASRLSGIQGGK